MSPTSLVRSEAAHKTGVGGRRPHAACVEPASVWWADARVVGSAVPWDRCGPGARGAYVGLSRSQLLDVSQSTCAYIPDRDTDGLDR